MDADGSGVIELARVLPATPDEVFRAWTDPEQMARWMSPVGSARADVDLRVGGHLRLVMDGAGMSIAHTGEYLEIDPPTRLSFTWRSEHTGGRDTMVTVALEPHPDGTFLRLRHERLSEEQAATHGQGWGQMVERLAVAMAG